MNAPRPAPSELPPLQVNGRAVAIEGPEPVRDALERAGYPRHRAVIIERNGQSVRAEDVEQLTVQPGDRLEVVQLIGGG